MIIFDNLSYTLNPNSTIQKSSDQCYNYNSKHHSNTSLNYNHILRHILDSHYIIQLN